MAKDASWNDYAAEDRKTRFNSPPAQGINRIDVKLTTESSASIVSFTTVGWLKNGTKSNLLYCYEQLGPAPPLKEKGNYEQLQ